MREQVLFACKPTPNYEVQFGVPLLNCKAAGPWLMQQIRFEGAGGGAAHGAARMHPSPSTQNPSDPHPFWSPLLRPTRCEACP